MLFIRDMFDTIRLAKEVAYLKQKNEELNKRIAALLTEVSRLKEDKNHGRH